MSNQPYLPTQNVPFSQEAEEAVIGSVLVNPSMFPTVASFLKPEDFFLLRNNYIWEALLRLMERDEQIDYLTLIEELRAMNRLDGVGGEVYIIGLFRNTPTSVHAEAYGRLVERAAMRRRLIATADEIRGLALNENLAIEEVVTNAESRLFSVTERQLKREMLPIREAIRQYYDRVEYLLQNQEEAHGVPTGFKDLDHLLGGFQKSDFIIFAGRPGMGKCVAKGTLVSTEHGTLPIEALKPEAVAGIADDEGGVYYPLETEIQTPTGMRKAAYLYDSGVKPTLRIKTRVGYSLTGTYVHPVLVLSKAGEKVWKTLDELECGDFVAVQPVAVAETAFYVAQAPELDWDEITSIEDSGMQHCYDLTVPDGHAFVANGIVSHNTSFLLSVVLNAARAGARTAIFTMEMSAEQIVQRIISMETGINMQKLRLGQMDAREWERFVEAIGRLGNLNIFIDDTPAMNPIQLRTKTRRLQHEYGVDLITLDYLQLMNSGATYENNRVQEISYISRNLKELAKELNVPILSAAQLSRAVEQRGDKRPILSDLRESGCLAGESLVYLPDSGQYVPIADLCGKAGFRVLSLNTETWKLEPAVVSKAWCTGVKPVYRMTTQLGRRIRATGNHKFLTMDGWKRLDELTLEDQIALPRVLPSPETQTMSDAELALLGHLIGDGCTLPTHAIQYTTREDDLAEIVAALAKEVFGDTVRPRIYKEPGRGWYQVFLPPTAHLTHRVHNPVRVWLEELGIFGLRSYEKFVPEKVFQQPNEAIARFLRHLWATDGCIGLKKTAKSHYPTVYYASSSPRLAFDVQSLLLRLGINARLVQVSQNGKGRDQYHVTVSGNSDLEIFSTIIHAVGHYKQESTQFVREYLQVHPANTNRDVIPNRVWRMYAVPAMQKNGVTTRQLHVGLGNAYCGTGIYKQNVGRERAARLAEVVGCEKIGALAQSDVYWDKITSIELDGETEVYDLTVPGNHNFVASNIITHNSLEQDTDLVMFLYRDIVYNEATEFPNQADIIIAKHRNGPTGTISLYFEKSITKFMDAAVRNIDLSEL
ncbi:MAG: replicative DNA helicase [Anaerolineae bacterium]